MKKILPYIIGVVLLGGLVAYFIYHYSPSTMEKAESEFAVRNIDDVTKINLTTQSGSSMTLSKKGKKWMVNDKYEANEEALSLLLGSIQKLETQYMVPGPAEAMIVKELMRQRNRCEIFLNGETEPSRVYDVGGPTPDGAGTYMIMEINGQLARHPYVTHIPGVNAYLTQRYFPDVEHWRSIWIFRDDHRSIDDLKVEFNREKEKSFELKRVGEDSFVIANAEGKVAEQPKQRHIHQYLDFFSALPILVWKNTDKALQDSVKPEVPYCTLTMKRADKTEAKAVIYYMPLAEWSRVQVDEATGRRLIYDIENLCLSANDGKDFALIQYHTWGNIFHGYDEFFKKPGEKK